MARIVAVLLTAAALLAAGRLSHAAPSTAEAFWRAVLPSSAVPDTVLRLLRADTSFVSKGNAEGAGQLSDLNYQDYMRSSHTAGKLPPSGDDAPYNYDYKSPSTSAPYNYDYKSPSTSAPYNYGYKARSGSAARRGGAATTTTTTVFFHEEAVRVGERLPFHFPAAAPAALGFLPRHVADSIPFSTPALPGVLALFGVPPGSAQAAAMEETLRTCEPPPPELDGEAMFCATSLEALVERAMAALGTRGVRAVTSTLPRAGAPLQLYTVRAVRPVAGASFVACHNEAYPYTVYRCHSTGPARAYMLEMEGARGGAVTLATVCHTDTSRWNPEHVSFKILDTKPGGAPICHLMPCGHIIWAKNEKQSPA